MSDTVLVALIMAIGTIIGGALTFRSKLLETQRETAVQIKQLEADLWTRIKKEIDEVNAELDAERKLRKALELELTAERELRKKAERELNEERKLRVALQKENDALRAGRK